MGIATAAETSTVSPPVASSGATIRPLSTAAAAVGIGHGRAQRLVHVAGHRLGHRSPGALGQISGHPDDGRHHGLGRLVQLAELATLAGPLRLA